MDSSAPGDSAPTASTPAISGTALPPIGLAFVDTIGSWCASFAVDSLKQGDRITLVFPDTADEPDVRARILARRSSACGAAFPQLSLTELVAYDLRIEDASNDAGRLPNVGIAVASDARWSSGPDGVMRADLNSDGHPEEATVCAVHEGQLFTLRSGDRKVWQGYFDWGVLVDVTCPADESG